MDSPEDKNSAGSVVRLPGIREDVTPSSPAVSKDHPELTFSGVNLTGAASSPPSTAMSSTPRSSQTSTRVSLQTPSTPRIDISRASSSSQHENSRESTPEREIFEGHDPNSAKLGMGFREEGKIFQLSLKKIDKLIKIYLS